MNAGNPPVTLFTTCKSFEGENKVMQVNALMSWKELGLPILLIGNDLGTGELAKQINAQHIADVKTNAQDTPLLSDLFARAKSYTNTPLLAYVNSDIILKKDFLSVIDIVSSLPETTLLAITRRFNIPNIPLNFTQDWQTDLRALAERYGSWDKDNAIDVFLFSRDLFSSIPDFAIGRMQWDNWLLWKAKEEGADIIDCSLSLTPLHPIHGYYGATSNWASVNQGTEAVNNRNLAKDNTLDIYSACTHILSDGHVELATSTLKSMVQSHCQQDTAKELAAGIEYLCNSTLSETELLECLKTLLWRREKYFSLTNIPDRMCKIALSKAHNYLKTGKLFNAEHVLQYELNKVLVDNLAAQQAKGREIFIWGAGTLGQRAMTFLAEHGIIISGAIDVKNAEQITLLGLRHYFPKDLFRSNEKPFVLITTIHTDEVTKPLNRHGYKSQIDYIM